MSNYPPGVTGTEPQIIGDPVAEAELPFRAEMMLEGKWANASIRFPSAKAAWDHGDHKMMAWWVPTDMRVMREGDDIPYAVYSCSGCAPYMAGGLAPSHRGSKGCESGSLASGGARAHCTCEACF